MWKSEKEFAKIQEYVFFVLLWWVFPPISNLELEVWDFRFWVNFSWIRDSLLQVGGNPFSENTVTQKRKTKLRTLPERSRDPDNFFL